MLVRLHFEVWHWSWNWEKVDFILGFVAHSLWGIYMMSLSLNCCLCETNAGHPRGHGGGKGKRMRLAGRSCFPVSSSLQCLSGPLWWWHGWQGDRMKRGAIPRAHKTEILQNIVATPGFTLIHSLRSGKPGQLMFPLICGFICCLSFPCMFCVPPVFFWWIHRLALQEEIYLPKNELYSLLFWLIPGWPSLLVDVRDPGFELCCITY